MRSRSTLSVVAMLALAITGFAPKDAEAACVTKNVQMASNRSATIKLIVPVGELTTYASLGYAQTPCQLNAATVAVQIVKMCDGPMDSEGAKFLAKYVDRPRSQVCASARAALEEIRKQ